MTGQREGRDKRVQKVMPSSQSSAWEASPCVHDKTVCVDRSFWPPGSEHQHFRQEMVLQTGEKITSVVSSEVQRLPASKKRVWLHCRSNGILNSTSRRVQRMTDEVVCTFVSTPDIKYAYIFIYRLEHTVFFPQENKAANVCWEH